MVTVQTRWLGPTNFRGARVKAYSEAFPRGVTVSYEHALNAEYSHHEAARAFITKRAWWGVWVFGASADGRGNVYTCIVRDIDGMARRDALLAHQVARALRLASTGFLWVRP